MRGDRIDRSPASRVSAWEARLALRFDATGDRTVLRRVAQEGPLVVQKPLYPEGAEVCQAIVIHPPGGIAGGDRLALAIDVGAGARAQLTTPGAAKWYRSTGAPAHQALDVTVAERAVCEWLPQEAILFNGAHAFLATRIALAADAVFIGWDMVCLGRVASGERFGSGLYRHLFELVRDDALIWAERTGLDGAEGLVASPVGLHGCPVFGTFVAAAPIIEENVLAACRRLAIPEPGIVDFAVTRLPGIMVARARGDSAEAMRGLFVALWQVARPALCRREAVPARIWST